MWLINVRFVFEGFSFTTKGLSQFFTRFRWHNGIKQSVKNQQGFLNALGLSDGGSAQIRLAICRRMSKKDLGVKSESLFTLSPRADQIRIAVFGNTARE